MKRHARSSAALAVVLGSTVLTWPVAAAPQQGVGSPAELHEVRRFATADHGVGRPAGLAWSAGQGALLVAEAATAATRVVSVTPDETTLRATRTAGPTDADTLAVDPRDGSVVSARSERVTAGLRLTSPDAMTFAADGALVVIDSGDLVRRGVGGKVARSSIEGTGSNDLRGLAVHPDTELLYTYDAESESLLALDIRGQLVESFDASSLELRDVQGVAIAPSADNTDEPSVQSLYLADASDTGGGGEIVEASLEPLAVVALDDVSGTLVRTTNTSSYDPPSPDTSGIAYLPGADRLFMSDSEVNEMSIFEGSNFFRATRSGALEETGDSLPWSEEPTGVGYNPSNNHLFVSDDDQKEVFEIVAGSDGRFGTFDDTVTQFDTNSLGNTDPEGLDYDTATNSIWIVDGVNREVFRVRPGGDGRFGTSDDVRSNFDVGVYGARDPEGIGYDAVRDTIVVVDDGSDTIYELDKNGALLNTIDASSVGWQAAAGLTVAPSSTGSGRNYFVVARGLDNDSNPNENDGRLYEISASLPPLAGAGNQAPVVNAGEDQNVILPTSATLDGTVADDGLPNPPGAVTTTWSRASGPGDVTFGNASAVDTTASFSAPGTYVLRLSAYDGAATSVDEVTVLVLEAGSASTIDKRVAAGSDDAEQALSGFMSLNSSDLELGADGSTLQVVGTRFTGLQIPQGATINNAYVQFRTDEVSTGATSVTIRAENTDNAATYQSTSGSMTARATTSASVSWSPVAWNTVGETGPGQRTPNIASVVQAVVNRSGWSAGNALAVQIEGTGRRTAEAYEGGPTFAPVLHVDFTVGGTTTNQAPVVDAGADATVTLPASAALDGTVTDDGLPDPPGATTSSWSTVSGPGMVTFGDASAVDTTASFGAAGTYVLRLTVSDSALSTSDDVTITVQPEVGANNQAPVVDAGPDATITLPSSASLNGSVVDDGLPDPPGTTTSSWSRTSGPGTVTFGDASAVDTTASFGVAGTYVLRLTASDSVLTAFDEVTITVEAEAGGGETQSLTVPVQAGADDAEERYNGDVVLTSYDLDITADGSRFMNAVGLRFAGVGVPAGATVTNAYVQFTADEAGSGATSFSVRAQAADSAGTFQATAANLSTRTTTSASAAWAPPAWTGGAAGVEQRTSNLASVLQEVVDRPGWAQGNAIALLVTGTGDRTARSAENPTGRPVLHLEFRTGGGSGTPTNAAPVVDAGADATVTLPASVALDGSVVDDGLPDPPGATTSSWSTVSGPGAVSFGDASAVDTTASFGVAGTYVLRLTASDSVLTAFDDVTITVQPEAGPTNAAPVVDAGADATVTLPASVALDGSVVDDGLPDPPGATTSSWSTVSGPGAVSFGDASAVDTTASFGVAGTYVLRLTASDSVLTAFDDVAITVQPAGTPQQLSSPIRAGADDGVERFNGSVQLTNVDLTLTDAQPRPVRVVGLRFTELGIPAGAEIVTAQVQFRSRSASSGATDLTIRAHAADSAPGFVQGSGSLTARPTTTASVGWQASAWTAGAAGAAQRTPDLSSVLQEVVDRPGWAQGNAAALLITGSGNRVADAFEGGQAPVLHLEWRLP